jgi:hypothetical protein
MQDEAARRRTAARETEHLTLALDKVTQQLRSLYEEEDELRRQGDDGGDSGAQNLASQQVRGLGVFCGGVEIGSEVLFMSTEEDGGRTIGRGARKVDR